MLETLKKHLDNEHKLCVVGVWVTTLDEEHQNLFAVIKEKNKDVTIAPLYKDLSIEEELPFQLTSFRSHLRGYCTCR